METLSFAFGMLTMVGVVFAALIVVNIVKVYKQQSVINGIKEHLRVIDERHESFRTQSYRDMNESNNNIYRSMHEHHEDAMRIINSQITDAVTQCNSYTDKRIDKIIVNSSTRDAKQILNESK